MRTVHVSFDQRADMVLFDLQLRAKVDFTEKVGRSLLANYNDHDELVSVEVLSTIYGPGEGD